MTFCAASVARRVRLFCISKDVLAKPLCCTQPGCNIDQPSSFSSSAERDNNNIVRSRYADVQLPDKSYFEVLWSNADKYAGLTALVDGVTGRSLDFVEAKSKSLSLGSELVRRGAKKNDVLAIFLPNCIEYPLILSGAAAAGVISTTLNPIYTPHEIAKQLVASKASWAITTEELLPVFQDALKQINSSSDFQVFIVGENSSKYPAIDELLTAEGDESILRLNEINIEEDICVLPFSSGTTGVPKGVMLTHRNIAGNIVQGLGGPVENCMVKPAKGDFQSVTICQLPLYHMFAMNTTMGLSMYQGAKVVVLPKFEPKLFSGALAKHRPTFLHLAPPLVSFIANSEMVKTEDLSNLEHIVAAAAPSGPSLIAAFKKKAPKGVVYREGWGMTETSPIVMTMPLNDEVHGSCGVLVPNTMARIVDVTTGELLGPNQQGELQTKGPQMMKGYFNNEKATAETFFDDGWMRTGDIATYDEEGRFYIVDRLKELIKVKGFQVPPAELEDLLRGHDDIDDVAIIGIPHEKLGEAPRAYVVPRGGSGLTAETAIKFVEERAASYKHLVGGVKFLDHIPKSAAGKILRKDLKAMYNEEKNE